MALRSSDTDGPDAAPGTSRPGGDRIDGVRRTRCLAMALVTVLIACGGGPDSDPDADSNDQATVPSTEAGQPPGGVAAEPGMSGARVVPGPDALTAGAIVSPGDTALVTARVAEYTIDLGQDTIGSGGIALQVRNEGDRPHTIELRATNGMRWVSIPIPPGGAVTMSMLLSPGDYTVSSVTAAYVERGMTAHLHVR